MSDRDEARKAANFVLRALEAGSIRENDMVVHLARSLLAALAREERLRERVTLLEQGVIDHEPGCLEIRALAQERFG